ncbi:MAG TPA: undecaprenyl-diphosphate phosphatase [bacterium]|nr:MAG: Undecaprenyl-diphosphatase [Parcubacteria group bacterium ADurb.Bin192]HPN14682.1 undecaprenyl-diphosphate phosphatase [bacterium]
MMDLISAVVLGVVEGATEFLPISSTGHLILFNQWFAFGEDFTKLFNIVIQSGAILAVIIIFWKDLWPSTWSLKELESKWGRIIAAFIPTAVIGLLLGDYTEKYLFTPSVVAAALIFYGLVFIFLEKSKKMEYAHSQIVYSHALIIGAAQALALVPGTSRSGATIVAMLLLGYTRAAAARFSFLLAIPTLLAASAYSLYKYESSIQSQELGLLAIGFIVSFIVAFAVSKWFLAYVSQKSFLPFAWYRIILGLLVLALVILN